VRPVGLLSLRPMDAGIPNAQHLTAREIVARLPAERFRVHAFARCDPDPRLVGAPQVRLRRLPRRGRSLRLRMATLHPAVDVLLHPNPDPFDDRIERFARRMRPRLRVAVHVVTTVRSDLWAADAWAILTRQMATAHLLTANSAHVADTVEAALGRRPVVVEAGVDLEVFRHEAAQPRSPVVVASVGSFQANKRPDLVLEAARRHPEVRFWMAGAGPGPLRSQVEDTVARERLGNVAVLDPMPQRDLARRLAASHVLFHPSDHEGAPQAILQAQACGCVPVARSTWRPPTVHDAENGLLAEDDEGLLRAVDRAVGDERIRERLRERAIEEARHRSWDTVVARWAELFWSAFGPAS
jgi:glycosyltransferase involved in cell wall biosynthesis